MDPEAVLGELAKIECQQADLRRAIRVNENATQDQINRAAALIALLERKKDRLLGLDRL